MKIQILCAITLLLWVSLSWAGGSIKYQICHFPPGDPSDFHTITVAEKALEAHLAHGDILGSCDQNCDTICDDGNPCTQDVDPTANECTCLSLPILVDCNDGNPCTTDICDSTTGGCENDPINCEDVLGPPNACQAQACDAVFGCYNEDILCRDDENPCTDDTCDPVQGCLYENICGG